MKTLYGGNSENCCGYCKLHHVGITPKQIRIKKCLEKHCQHFSRYNGHWVWKAIKHKEKKKKESKELRRQRKARQKEYYENLQKEQKKNADS